MKDLKSLEPIEYLWILWRRKWYFAIITVVVIIGASIYSYMIPDVFKSETRILVEEPLGSDSYARSKATPEQRIGTIRQQLASRSFLERMIEQFQMYGYGTRSDFVMENAVKAAERQIGIEKTSENTFTISFVATDPQFAQTFTRQLSQELIRISTTTRKDRVLANDQFIDEQLRQSTEALAAQEQKITQFKLAHLGELPAQATVNMSALTGLHSQLSSVENAIQQAQERQKLLDFNYQERKRLSLAARNLAVDEKGVITSREPEKRLSPEEAELAAKKSLLEQYMAKYTVSHPDVVTAKRDIARLEQQVSEQKTVKEPAGTPAVPAKTEAKTAVEDDALESAYQFQSDSIKAEIAKREKERQELLRQIKLYQGRLNLAPALEQELATLMREEDVLKSRYETLQKQKFNTQMASNVEADNRNETYRVIDEANLPAKPESPNRLQLILMGIGGGLAAGIGAAIGRELIDSTIGSEEEAKKVLNLPVLVTIPTVEKAGHRFHKKTA